MEVLKLLPLLSGVKMRCPAVAVAIILLFCTQTVAKEFDLEKLCEAIKNKWELRIVYRAGEGQRVVIPGYLGFTRVRNVILSGLQISGFSQSGNLPGHRSFRLDRTSDILFTTTITPGAGGGGNAPNGVIEDICVVR